MKPWMVVFGLFIGSPAAGADLQGAFGRGATDAFTVLDVNLATGFAAIKVVSHLEDWSEGDGPSGTVDCHYAGMSAMPKSGVAIATWNLATGVHKDFVVYALATAASECSAEATNSANLAAAKADAATHGLDVTKKPALISAKGDKVVVAGHTIALGTTTEDHYEDLGTNTLVATLSADGKTLYQTSGTYSPNGAGHLDVHVVGAIADGTRAVVVLSVTTGNMRSPDETGYVLTPILDLK